MGLASPHLLARDNDNKEAADWAGALPTGKKIRRRRKIPLYSFSVVVALFLFHIQIAVNSPSLPPYPPTSQHLRGRGWVHLSLNVFQAALMFILIYFIIFIISEKVEITTYPSLPTFPIQ